LTLETANPLLWLAWAVFGTFLGGLLWKRYRPEVLRGPALPRETPRAAPAWLFCEDGAPLDRRVRWFELRPGGRTIAGRRPRASTEETHYLYLTADDIQEEHALIAGNPESGRYEAEALGAGIVLHNNEPLPPGERAELADGDTLDLGRVSRFRFTLTGPEES
jgi:hypothetical protein